MDNVEDYISKLIENDLQIPILNLSNRCLKFIPNQLHLLKHLKCLNLGNNSLISISDEIGNELRELEELTLENNQLTLLPSSFSNLVNLKCFNLSSNHLCCLNGNLIGTLTSLTSLWLNSCELMCLPNEIGKLINLEKLSLKDNQLVFLPEQLCELKKLRWLNLAGNQLNKLPNEFNKLKCLNCVNLNDNQFVHVPSQQLLDLHELNFVYLKNNCIDNLSFDTIIQFSCIQLLDLRSNPFIDCFRLNNHEFYEQLLKINNFRLQDTMI